MKAVLEFNLPEEQEAFELAVAAHKYRTVLTEFDQSLRDDIKYPKEPTKNLAGLIVARDRLWEFLKEEGISLW